VLGGTDIRLTNCQDGSTFDNDHIQNGVIVIAESSVNFGTFIAEGQSYVIENVTKTGYVTFTSLPQTYHHASNPNIVNLGLQYSLKVIVNRQRRSAIRCSERPFRAQAECAERQPTAGERRESIGSNNDGSIYWAMPPTAELNLHHIEKRFLDFTDTKMSLIRRSRL